MHPAKISENQLRRRRQDHENEIRLLEFRFRLPITPLYKVLAVRFRRATLKPKRIGECS